MLTDQLYSEPLISLDANGRPMPRLAEHWSWENEGRTLRVVLRRGTELHDGRILDAATARRFLLAAIKTWRRDFRGALDGLMSVEATDSSTLLLHLREPDAFLISELNNAHLVDPDNPNIGSGPFRLISRKPVNAERFDRYYRGPSHLQRVQISSFDSQRAAWAALMRNEVDALPDIARDSIQFLDQSAGVKTFASLRPFYWALSFNLRHSQLSRAEVRRAISAAINREEIISRALRGYATIAVDPVWPLHWAYSPGSGEAKYDPEKARSTLSAAGITASGHSSRLRLRCLFFGEDPQLERMALMVARQFNAVGIELDLEPVAYQPMLDRLAAGDFDVFLSQMQSGRGVDWTYRFWHSPAPGEQPMLLSGYQGADAILDRLRHSYSDADVREGIRELRQRFQDDVPAVFIAWLQMTRAVSTRFDIGEAQKSDVFGDVWQWRLADEKN